MGRVAPSLIDMTVARSIDLRQGLTGIGVFVGAVRRRRRVLASDWECTVGTVVASGDIGLNSQSVD